MQKINRITSDRIEFVKGEKYCRFDGIVMTPEACIDLYGFDGEFELFDDGICVINGTTYTDKSLYDIVMLLGTVHGEVEEYDVIASQGRGRETYYFEKQLENTIVIPIVNLDCIKRIKPLKDLKDDYPNLNIEKYDEFYGCLDKYHDKLRDYTHE